MEIFKRKEDCCGCTACFNICPKKSIEMKRDEEGFLYPSIDENLCIECKLCIKICPVIEEKRLKSEREDNFYLAKHKNIDVLKNSTSGGAFTAISDMILEEGGYICGVDFDENFDVVHRITDNKEGRNRFRFSKYVQTSLEGIFGEIKEKLKERKKVLFTGTPCQCAGLKSFIGNGVLRENLYICDIICHSIPSPRIWDEFKKLLEEENGGSLDRIHFRTKRLPWTRENSNKAFLFSTTQMKELDGDERFYKMFFNLGTICRPSCSECRFTDIHRVSDITIADYWGIEEFDENKYDPLGVSVLIVNNDKGDEILKGIEAKMDIEKRPAWESLRQQKRLSSPMIFPENRFEFWKDLEELGLGKTLLKWNVTR